MTAEPYCDFSDLRASQCACTRCRPDVTDPLLDGELVTAGRGALLDEPTFEPTARLFEAMYPFSCGCGVNVRAGSMIARTTDGDYVCSGCS
jgi:hypothetical protein